jgi:acetoacetate decarboxylase
MSKLRYVKTLDQVKKARENDQEFLQSSMRQIRCEYLTDPAIHRALVPKPLEPAAEPAVCVTFTDVTMQISPDYQLTIGAVIFGVKASYDGVLGVNLITMPMTTEQAVIGGRETYGEPKKIAQIELAKDGDRVSASCARMGMTYLSAAGTIGEEIGPREFTQHAYCFKMFPSCDQQKTFDSDPLLIRLNWLQKHTGSWKLDGELVLGQSPVDPVADVPIRELTRFEYEEGTTQSNGQVLRSVPEEWMLPILHQRYDDASGDGIEVSG